MNESFPARALVETHFNRDTAGGRDLHLQNSTARLKLYWRRGNGFKPSGGLTHRGQQKLAAASVSAGLSMISSYHGAQSGPCLTRASVH